MNELTIKALEGELFTAKDTVRVVGRPRPLLQEHINVELPAGHTVAELIEMACGKRKSHMPVAYAASIDGVPVPAAMQDRVRIKPGHTLTFEPRLAGENARNIALLAVAVVAIVVATVVFGPAGFFTTSALFAALAGAAVGVAGSLAVNALFPIAPQKTPLDAQTLRSGSQESVYSISGSRNSAAPFDPIPSILGRVRVYPRYAAMPFTSFEGTDQYLRMLFVIGYGPLDLSELKIGETDLDSFEDVEYEVFEGYEDDDDPSLYTRAAFEEQLSVDLSDHDGTWFERTTETDVSSIGGDIFAPQGWFERNSEGKYEGINFKMRIEYREAGSGDPWTLIVNRDDDDFRKKEAYRFGFSANVTRGENIAYTVRVRSTSNTPDDDNSQIVQTLQWVTLRAFRPGAPIRFNKPLAKVALKIKASGQLNSIIDTFNLVAESRVEALLDSLSSAFNPARTHANITLSNGNLVAEHTGVTGTSYSNAFTSASVAASGVSYFRFEFTSENGDPTVDIGFGVGNASAGLAGNTTDWLGHNNNSIAIYRSGNVWRGGSTVSSNVIPDIAEGDVIIMAVSRANNKIWWRKSDGEWNDNNDTNNPDDNLGGISISAVTGTLFAGISCERPMTITAYDAGFVSGGDEDETRNPADLMRHVLQGPAIYQPVSDELIDFDAIDAFREYCDDEGWEYNREHSFRGSVFETLQTIASAGRGRVTRTDGKWGVIWDEADVPVAQHFSHRNSWGFEEFRVYMNPPHAYRCPFVNEQKGWAADERIVYDDDHDEDNSTIFESIEFPGVTDPDKIWRLARFQMAQVALRPSTYSLTTNWQALSCTVGSRVYANHDVAEWGIASGRVEQVRGDTIVLDEEVTLTLGVNYLMRFRQADGTSVVRVVTVPAVGATRTLVLAASASPDPEVGDLVMFGNDVGGPAVLLRVRDIEWLPELNARLTLVDDAPGIAEADEDEIPPYDSQVTAPTNVFLRQPYNLIVISQTYILNTNIIIKVMINWGALAVDVTAFDVDMRNDNLVTPVWERVATVGPETLSVEVDDVAPGIYSFRVRSVFGGNLGWSAWTELLGIEIVQSFDVPPDVSNFKITNLGDVALLSWSPVAAPNISHYVIRQSGATVDVSWGTASILFDHVVGTTIPAPPLSGTYLIKAFDYAGLESTNPASIISTAVNLRDLNVVETLDHSPTWPGIKNNLTVDAGELVLDGTSVGGTNIGNMTSGGGLAAAFDGGTSEATVNCATRTGTDGYVGKTLAFPMAFDSAVIFGSADEGYVDTINPTVTAVIRGKTGAAPASRTDGTDIGSISFTDTVDESTGRTITSTDTTTEWDHIWLDISHDGASQPIRVAELQIFDAAGLYEFDEIVDLGSVYTSRISVSLTAYGDNTADFIASWLTLSEVLTLGGALNSDWGIRIEERHTDDDPGGSPVEWTEWTELTVTDITARAFDFRMYLFSFNPDVDVRVVTADISIDMPDRIEGIGDFVVSNVGTPHVSFSVPFKFLETVLVTAIQGASTGDYSDVTNRDEEGFDIMVFDAADARVTRTVDILAVGYGKAVM